MYVRRWTFVDILFDEFSHEFPVFLLLLLRQHGTLIDVLAASSSASIPARALVMVHSPRRRVLVCSLRVVPAAGRFLLPLRTFLREKIIIPQY